MGFQRLDSDALPLRQLMLCLECLLVRVGVIPILLIIRIRQRGLRAVIFKFAAAVTFDVIRDSLRRFLHIQNIPTDTERDGTLILRAPVLQPITLSQDNLR